MKKQTNYYKIKWSSFFTTVAILAFGLLIVFFITPQKQINDPTPTPNELPLKPNQEGYYTNTAFSRLIEENLSELGFIEQLEFQGQEEGQFTISGVLSHPERLSAICADLKPFEGHLNALKDEPVSIKGHLGENDAGNGCFVSDTITFSGYTLPAGSATDYIEEYTGLNDLLEVPFYQIRMDETGVLFQEEIPAAINQIASYIPLLPSPEA